MIPSNYRMTLISRVHTYSFHRVRGVLVSLVSMALSCLVAPFVSGCSGSASIRESQLEISPTESSSSFSRTSQSSITELVLTSDLLANPPALEAQPSLTSITPSARALLLSEAWFLKGQNDIEVPIATSLDRFIRAAHFAYDAIFTGTDCEVGKEQLCADLFISYNRSVREIGRLTSNGAQLPPTSESGYLIDRIEDGDHLNLDEWTVYLSDATTSQGHPTFGAAGAACQTITANTSSQSTAVRRCAPTTLTVSFDSRADAGHSRAHFAAYNTFGHKNLTLHSKELHVPIDLSFTWSNIFTPPPTEAIATSCLTDIEPQLPTVFLAVSPPSESHWPTVAANLTSDPHIQDHYNFCVLFSGSTEAGAAPSQIIRGSLDAITPGLPEKPAIIVITQGAEGEGILRQLKDTLKQRTPTSPQNLLLAGSLALPSASAATQAAAGVEAFSQDLTKQELSSVADMKRLLTRLADPEDGVFGAVTRSSLPSHSGMTLSPVM